MTLVATAELFQFASDLDGDLHLFPKHLDEPDYTGRWKVWVVRADGTRTEAPLCEPQMCVFAGGVVRNPLHLSGHRDVAGWYVDGVDATGIEVAIDGGGVVRIPHPRARPTSRHPTRAKVAKRRRDMTAPARLQ